MFSVTKFDVANQITAASVFTETPGLMVWAEHEVQRDESKYFMHFMINRALLMYAWGQLAAVHRSICTVFRWSGRKF